mgnify:CR=1 FL=1
MRSFITSSLLIFVFFLSFLANAEEGFQDETVNEPNAATEAATEKDKASESEIATKEGPSKLTDEKQSPSKTSGPAELSDESVKLSKESDQQTEVETLEDQSVEDPELTAAKKAFVAQEVIDGAKFASVYSKYKEALFSSVKNKNSKKKSKSKPAPAGEVKKASPEVYKELIPIWNNAMDLYNNQKWDEAIKEFKECDKLEENYVGRPTTPCKVYISRCEEFKINSPGKDWDGTYSLKSK